MTTFSAWLQASRLPSQAYIFFPLLLGQGAYYYNSGGWFDWSAFTLVFLYGLFLQLFIVYANDRADVETDRLNTTYTLFSGGSRTLVNGLLSVRENYFAVLIMLFFTVVTGVLFVFVFSRALAPLFITASIVLLWLYSFPPVRMSYRGGGEMLQMIGVGVLLPVFGYYVQAGSLIAFPWPVLAFILPGQLACAMATALPDEPSDRISRKRTATVLMGAGAVRLIIVVCNASAAGFFVLVMPGPLPWRMAAAAVPLCLCGCMLLLRHGSRPGTRRLALFVACAVGATVLLTSTAAVLFFVI